MSNTESVYKIFTPDQWSAFQADEVFKGSPVDVADGFIHLSSASQMQGTLDKHYTAGTDVVIAEINMPRLDGVKWEVSRGGTKFPHQYGVLTLDDIVRHSVLSPNQDGRYQFVEN